MAHPVLRPPAARTVIRWQQCVLSITFLQHRCCISCCCPVLSLATLDEVQRHNRDDEADEGLPCAQRMFFSRERRDEDVLEHSKQLIAHPLITEPASKTRRSLELTFACPTPAYQTPPERAQKKNKKTTNSIRLMIRPILMQLDLQSVEKVPFSTFA